MTTKDAWLNDTVVVPIIWSIATVGLCCMLWSFAGVELLPMLLVAVISAVDLLVFAWISCYHVEQADKRIGDLTTRRDALQQMNAALARSVTDMQTEQGREQAEWKRELVVAIESKKVLQAKCTELERRLAAAALAQVAQREQLFAILNTEPVTTEAIHD